MIWSTTTTTKRACENIFKIRNAIKCNVFGKINAVIINGLSYVAYVPSDIETIMYWYAVMQYYKYSLENEKFLSIGWFYREKYTHLPQSAPTRERRKKIIIQINFNNTNLNFSSSHTTSTPIFMCCQLSVLELWIWMKKLRFFLPLFSGNCSLYDNYDNEWSENMKTFNLIREPEHFNSPAIQC